jgi:hypothetical protein
MNFIHVRLPSFLCDSQGPGALTRSLLKLPKDKLQKLIVLEDNKLYLEHLRVCVSISILIFVDGNNAFVMGSRWRKLIQD